MTELFPEMIRNLPEADLPFRGVRAYLSQAEDHQIIFMEFSEDVEVPAHAHAAQLGIVLEGKIEMVIAGERKIYEKGERYYIPKGVIHSAKVHKGYADVTYFDEADRYHLK